jgi:hypothetical protein
LEKLFRLAPIVVLPLILTHPCTAQTCNAAPHPETNSGYAYMREEMKALRWIRSALLESTKIQPPGAREDPQHVHKLIELHSTAEAVADRYNCAVSILQNFKDSKNEYIKESAETLLKALETTKKINEKLASILDSIYDAKRSQDIDQAGIAKMREDEINPARHGGPVDDWNTGEHVRRYNKNTGNSSLTAFEK